MGKKGGLEGGFVEEAQNLNLKGTTLLKPGLNYIIFTVYLNLSNEHVCYVTEIKWVYIKSRGFPYGTAAKTLDEDHLWTGSVTNTLINQAANDSALSKRVKQKKRRRKEERCITVQVVPHQAFPVHTYGPRISWAGCAIQDSSKVVVEIVPQGQTAELTGFRAWDMRTIQSTLMRSL